MADACGESGESGDIQESVRCLDQNSKPRDYGTTKDQLSFSQKDKSQIEIWGIMNFERALLIAIFSRDVGAIAEMKTKKIYAI